MNNDLLKRVKKLLIEIIEIENINEKDIHITDSFSNDLGVDSLEFIEIILAVEEEFSINIPDNTADKIQTIQNLMDAIESAKNIK